MDGYALAWNFWLILCCIDHNLPNTFNLLRHLMHRLLPESVVWLYANNRVAEAEQIIRNAAKLNNITMPEKIFAKSDADDYDSNKKKGTKLLEKVCNLMNSGKLKKKEVVAHYTVIDICRNRHLTINILCMAFAWSVHQHVNAV